MIDPDDRGFLLGDGLFETVLFRRGQPMLWDAHMVRLVESCAAIGLPAPEPDACLTAARRAITEARMQDRRVALRLNWSAGPGPRGLDRPEEPAPRLTVRAALATKPEGGATLATASIRRNPTAPTSRLKTLSYLDNVIARREAEAAGAEEALMLDGEGRLACAAAANLFWLADGALFTPSLDCGALDGVMRGVVISAAEGAGLPVSEVAAPSSVLDRAQAVFLTSSLIGVRPVATLDGRAIPQGAIPSRVASAAAAVS